MSARTKSVTDPLVFSSEFREGMREVYHDLRTLRNETAKLERRVAAERHATDAALRQVTVEACAYADDRQREAVQHSDANDHAIDMARLEDAAYAMEAHRELEIRVRALEQRTWRARWSRFVDWIMGYLTELGAADPVLMPFEPPREDRSALRDELPAALPIRHEVLVDGGVVTWGIAERSHGEDLVP